jgi:hypothetical protein
MFCQDNDIDLVPTEKGTIKVRGDKTVLTTPLMEAMKANKRAILNLLNIMDVFYGHILSNDRANDPAWQWMDLSQYPRNLPEGTYKWKDNQWK